MRALVLLLLLLVGCSRSPSAANAQSSADASRASAASAPAASAPGSLEPGARSLAREAVTFTGMCDASAAVEISERIFAVADDEDNVIRTYDTERGGAPLSAVDLSPGLNLPVKPSKKPKPGAETDLEAATRIGDRAYWITSHARKRSGKYAPERLRFFSTTIPSDAAPITVVGTAYEGLIDDLLAEPAFHRYGFARAVELAPTAPGGFNIEGMTARKEGGVWLGFRNPVPDGKALLIPLLNPEELVDGGRAAFGDAVVLDLGGLTVRALSAWRDHYLIAAGNAIDGGTPRLFTWDGSASARAIPALDLRAFNPEGFFTPDAREQIFVLSDDGTVPIDGVPCKKLDDQGRKRFRGAWLPFSRR
ncbi:MAG TPA: DUF3616 domain-containing protein [Polyangiaceae bacterium]